MGPPKLELEILTSLLPGYSKGQRVRVDVDPQGTPLEPFWRRRLRDADLDGSLRVVAPVLESPPPADEWEADGEVPDAPMEDFE